MASSFGHSFRVTSFGESHGGGVGVVIDGCPAGYSISLEKIQAFLDRRRPGQSVLSTPRQEKDQVVCLSGLEGGKTLGTPIALVVYNKDAKKDHYTDMTKVFRPSHADYTTELKYGIRAVSGGGRASARETIARVAAAALAEQVLEELHPSLKVIAYVESVKHLQANSVDVDSLSREKIDEHMLRCPDEQAREQMSQLILEAKKKGDSVGGCIRCLCLNPPKGLGEPVFDKLEADLAKAMMSLPASKGFEVGEGFAATQLFGSEHNDHFEVKNNEIRTTTNFSGGIQGGISNGENISMRIAFKPVATIFKEQQTVDRDKNPQTFKPKAGRHDPCVLPRAVPMVEAMTLLVLMDHFLRQKMLASCAKSDASLA
ncbi:MAG: chorismate synthase [Oligoflexales bacterium]|nr:chorismate synthase [Oligoflexales bacterium]